MCLSDPASANPSDWYYPSVFALKFRQRGTSPCTSPRGPLDVDRRVLALKSRARTPEVSSGEHPNPQRRTTLEKMSVQCLYLPMDPDFRIGLALKPPPEKNGFRYFRPSYHGVHMNWSVDNSANLDKEF
jgi:hypothetical protein